jgi:hypothetical protein
MHVCVLCVCVCVCGCGCGCVEYACQMCRLPHQLYYRANHFGMFAEAKSCVGSQKEKSRKVTDTSV